TKLLSGCIKAFLVGGIICCIGQGINMAARYFLLLDTTAAGTLTTLVLVFLGATLTGLGVYDDLGRFAGGGSIVPITGFANSIVSPAMEHKREGYILGIGSNMFKVAGPVIVNGVSASVIYGIIRYIIGLF
ncbi:SpoVA/SpoVAEb family sporulation membrane protein, partial [Eubacteriales bacterium OttesenSCG-928-M02]|nr:SpoVA/SpoVAEb family sporulation membrane protein [Eubacteriales bacterium OttesenSCG-928-M02]